MKLNSSLGLKLIGAWFIIWGLGGYGIFNISIIHASIMPLLAIIAGILILIR